jgi:hypothetical protein
MGIWVSQLETLAPKWIEQDRRGNSKILVTAYQAKRCHNLEDHSLNLHYHDDLISLDSLILGSFKVALRIYNLSYAKLVQLEVHVEKTDNLL